MIARLASALLILLVGSGAWSQDSKVFDLPYLMRDLPNGLRVVIVRTDYPDIVTLHIPVQTGSRNEVEPGKSGFAHFFEHMMFRGTKNYSSEQYNAIINSTGADQNAYTSDDLTNYHTTFTKTDLEKVIALEADRFMNLEYTEDQFRTEALAVKGEYLKNHSEPVESIFEKLRDLSFTVHSYKHTTIGFLKDIEDMPNQIAYAKTFFDRWYRPEHASVIVVGDVDPEATFKLVQKYFGPWQRGNYQLSVPTEPPATGPKAEHIKWEAPTQPYVTLAFRGPAFRSTDKEMPAVDLIGRVWFGETSDLYQQLIVKEQLVDELFFYAPDRKDPNLITIGARLVKAESAQAVSDAIASTLVRARTERVPEQKLASIKSALKYGFASSLDNSADIGDMLSGSMHFERDPEAVNRQYRSYDALTAEELLAAANRYFIDQSRVLVTLSNTDSLPGAALDPLDARVVKSSGVAPIAMLERKGSSPLVAVNFLFATGAALDPPGKKGLAKLTADMIVDAGSEARSYRELTELRYPLAAGFGAQVDKEMISLRGVVHRDNLSKWSDLALEQLLTPGFSAEDFKRVKTTLVNAIRSNLRGNNDEELAKEVLYESVYGAAHPYGTLSLGDVSDLEALTLQDVQQFYAAQFTQANLTLAVGGGYSEEWLQGLRRSLGKLPAGRRNSFAVAKPSVAADRHAVIVEKETASVAVSFGFPLDIKRGDKDWAALWLARSWLGEHRQGGQLFDRIREVRGMNYGDYAYIEYFPNGMFEFFASPNLSRQHQIFQVWIRPLRDNSDAVFATRVALYELDRLLAHGLTREQFSKQREFLQKYVSQFAKTQAQQLGDALDSRYYGIPDFPTYARNELAKLTLADVNRAIRKHWQTRNLHFVFVTRDATDLVRRLTQDLPSPIKYPAPKPELAAEDAVIDKLPLRLPPSNVRVRKAEEVFE